MRKHFAIVFIVVQFVCLLSGCSSLFDHTYTSESDFKGSQEIALDDTTEVVKSYSALRRLIYNMVNTHTESAELLISGYSGDVASDIASICGSVNIDSAYGAYCVEYVSYDLTQIVSYYEATIDITYRYTADEVAGILTTSNNETFSELIAEEMSDGAEHIVVKVNNGVGDEQEVQELIQRSCRNHPMSISYVPEVSVNIFSGSNSQKIYEINIDYSALADSNNGRLSALAVALGNVRRSIPVSSEAWMVVNAARYLSSNCAVKDTAGNTAYDALVNCSADSEGVAVAFKAICDKLEIDCQVIQGKLDKDPHFWNIVELDDAYYHVDVSELLEKGGEASLFLTDSEKLSSCWWELSNYPACDGKLDYSAVVEPGIESVEELENLIENSGEKA